MSRTSAALAAALTLACTHAASTPAAPAAPVSVAPDAPPPDDCARACGRFAACEPAAAPHTPECQQDCRAELTPAGAARYADCLGALSCEAVAASLTMNEGPAGRCYPREAPYRTRRVGP